MTAPSEALPANAGAELRDPEAFLRATLAGLTGTSGEAFDLDEPFTAAAGVDSLVLLQMVAACEEAFQVRIPDEEFERLRTLGDLIRCVERECAGRSH